jgi:hypothetical protein
MIWLATWSAAVLVICMGWHWLHRRAASCTVPRYDSLEAAEACRSTYPETPPTSERTWASYQCGRCGSFHVGLRLR